jgi:hypothetical protein
MWADQKMPLHGVTLGWGDGDRQWVEFSYAQLSMRQSSL